MATAIDTKGTPATRLALSGGGFRATLFHLGVITALRDAGQLTTVTSIRAVSGGSVLAAHLALNWSRYTGDKVAFTDASEELVAFCRSGVRNRAVRRWLISAAFAVPKIRRADSISSYLKNEFHRLYSGPRPITNWLTRRADVKKLEDLGANGAPAVCFMGTSLTTGTPCAFSSQGYCGVTRKDDNGENVHGQIRATQLPIAQVVTASCAFPPVFPPVRIDNGTLGCTKKEFPIAQFISDGGLYDNLAIAPLALPLPAADRLLVSNAEALFDWDIDEPFKGVVRRNARASDVLMSRIGELEINRLPGTWQSVISIKIGATVSRDKYPDAAPEESQRSLQTIRTDLDRFSRIEANALINHGYLVACEALGLQAITLPRQRTTVSHTRGAALRLGLWSATDFASWVLLPVGVGEVLLILAVLAKFWYTQPLLRIGTTVSDFLMSEMKHGLFDLMEAANHITHFLRA